MENKVDELTYFRFSKSDMLFAVVTTCMVSILIGVLVTLSCMAAFNSSEECEYSEHYMVCTDIIHWEQQVKVEKRDGTK
jgi:hypothetical protein